MSKNTSSTRCNGTANKLKNIKAKIDAEDACRGYDSATGVGLDSIWNADISDWENDRYVIDDCIEIIKRSEALQNAEDTNRKRHSELERLAVLAGIKDAAEQEAGAKARRLAASRIKRVTNKK